MGNVSIFQLGMCLVVLLGLVSPAVQAGAPSGDAAPGDADVISQMLDWMEAGAGWHFKHNVVIKTPPGGERGVFARKDIKSGSLVARIPMSVSFLFNETLDPDDFGWLNMSASLAVEAAKGTDSFFYPYLRAEVLPMLYDHMHTFQYVMLPPEYFPLLKSKNVEEVIREAQQDLKDYWGKHGGVLSQQGVTLDGLKAACVTMATRVFAMPGNDGDTQMLMHPLLDMVNHLSSCTTKVGYRPCPDDDEADELGLSKEGETDDTDVNDLCLYWTAGDDIREGEELCLKYEVQTPDQAFFEYGFIMPDDPPAMSNMDAVKFSWNEKVPSKVGGKVSAMKKELKRLDKRIKTLEGAGKQEAAMKVAPGDPGGAVLRGLKRLRQQRLTALRNEVARLGESIAAREEAIEAKEAEAGKDEL